jgi:hypothetical protein
MKELTNSTISDACPAWATELIAKILVLEVEVGTIKSPGDKTQLSHWSTTQVDELMKVASRLDQSNNSDTADISATIEGLFAKVVRGLNREGHSTSVIAAMINARIPTGCRLPYCNADEVQAALD